jgi:hypothetical protein
MALEPPQQQQNLTAVSPDEEAALAAGRYIKVSAASLPKVSLGTQGGDRDLIRSLVSLVFSLSLSVLCGVVNCV